MKNVLILMASYNGERYISEQLESILAQSYTNWKLIIQDDGSTDDTVNIIKYYMRKDSRISLCFNESVYHGAFQNFHILINKCKELESFDYYMFCDQDDIWNKDKIETMLGFMNDQKPELCYADMRLIDADGRLTSESLNRKWKLEKNNYLSVLFSNKALGCNMILNKALFEQTTPMDMSIPNIDTMSHDAYYAMSAAILGECRYIDIITMDYRRYDQSVTSDIKYETDIRRVIYRLFHLNDLAKKHAIMYNQTLVTFELLKTRGYRQFSNNSEDYSGRNCPDFAYYRLKNMEKIEKVLRTGGFRTLGFVDKYDIQFGRRIENISRKMILLSGLYKKYLI